MKLRSLLSVGSVMSVLLGASQSQASAPAFQVRQLVNGYSLAAADTQAAANEGKCGEGKCGLPMMDKNKDGKVTFEEAKIGGFSLKQFKAWDENGDGVLDKKELDKMHSTKGKEGYCS